jgi:flagellar basal-body rod modification protein FlgD
MQTNPINTLGTVGSTERVPKPTLDKDGFLKLMMEQLRHQDPSAPQDSSTMVAQMAQLTSVEQMTNLTASVTEQAKEATFSRAEGLLGRTVTYVGSDGLPVSGTVEKVDISGDKPKLTIGGVDGIDPATLSEVR